MCKPRRAYFVEQVVVVVLFLTDARLMSTTDTDLSELENPDIVVG